VVTGPGKTSRHRPDLSIRATRLMPRLKLELYWDPRGGSFDQGTSKTLSPSKALSPSKGKNLAVGSPPPSPPPRKTCQPLTPLRRRREAHHDDGVPHRLPRLANAAPRLHTRFGCGRGYTSLTLDTADAFSRCRGRPRTPYGNPNHQRTTARKACGPHLRQKARINSLTAPVRWLIELSPCMGQTRRNLHCCPRGPDRLLAYPDNG
jgi:hypothetical protein